MTLRPRWPHFVVRLRCAAGKHPAAYPIDFSAAPGPDYWSQPPRNLWACECGQEIYEYQPGAA